MAQIPMMFTTSHQLIALITVNSMARCDRKKEFFKIPFKFFPRDWPFAESQRRFASRQVVTEEALTDASNHAKQC